VAGLRAAASRLRAFVGRPWEATATFVYFCILTANRLVLRSTQVLTLRNGRSLNLGNLLLRSVSTNLSQLRHDPVTVLVTSAFFVQSIGELVAFAIAAVLVLAPLERRIGAGRWLLAFALGHVGATLIVAVGLNIAVQTHHVAADVVRTIDVGMSYGTVCLLAVAASVLVTDRARVVWSAVVVGAVVIGLAAGQTYTDWGHFIAAVIGLLTGEFVRRWVTRARLAAAVAP